MTCTIYILAPIDAESGRKGGYVNKRNHSFIMESKLSDVRGRVDYISSPERQEHLYAVYSDVQDHYYNPRKLEACFKLAFYANSR